MTFRAPRPWPPSCNLIVMMSLPVRNSDVGSRTPRSSTFLTGEWSVGTGVTRLGGRFLSRGRVALGALHWLSWIIVSPRSVVSGGVARELDTLGVGALRLVGSASILVGLIATFQVAYQLKQYGAESVSALAIGWFATREVGPLVVALLVVTRSASAIAGEFAAMTSGGEIDARPLSARQPAAPSSIACWACLPPTRSSMPSSTSSRPSSSERALEVHHLTGPASAPIIFEIEIFVARGETLLVLGPIQSGKSMLMRHLVGLECAVSGTIAVDGEAFDPTKPEDKALRRLRSRVGVLFEGSALLRRI